MILFCFNCLIGGFLSLLSVSYHRHNRLGFAIWQDGFTYHNLLSSSPLKQIDFKGAVMFSKE